MNRTWRPGPFLWLQLALHGGALLLLGVRPQAWPWALAAVLLGQLMLMVAGLWPRSRWLGANLVRLPGLAAALVAFEAPATLAAAALGYFDACKVGAAAASPALARIKTRWEYKQSDRLVAQIRVDPQGNARFYIDARAISVN